MIDQNAIIEIINTSLPVVASSPVIIKLINVIEDVIKTLYLPALTIKKGRAEVDIEIYRKQKEKALLENQAFTLYEIAKLKNFISTANFSVEEIQKVGDESFDDEVIDFDWVMRFFDAVSNVSSENLQRLWGKVLAGEVKQPGTCSLRTLDIIRNLSPKEAETFTKLCKYVLKSGDCYFIFHSGFSEFNGYNEESCDYITKTGLNYSDSIIPMIESGLLSIDNNLATDFKINNVLGIQNQEIACFIIADKSKDNFLSIEPYFLTTSGIQLYNIICGMSGYKANIEYPILCFKELKNIYPDLKISAHKILGEDDFDPNDLL